MSTVVSYSPRSGEPVSQAESSEPTSVSGAVAVALGAAISLAQSTPIERRSYLYAIADALEANADKLVELADLETALGAQRLAGEVTRTAAQTRFYGDVAVEGSYLGVTIDDEAGLVRFAHPIGPVAVFGASNFPFVLGLLGHDTAAAIAAGCPVIGKAHSAHVGLSEYLAELAREALRGAGAPEGTFGMVVGRDAGTRLVEAAGVAAVAFTGSESGGLALWRAAMARPIPIPVYAEMGTVNPVVVTPSRTADLEEIARTFVASFSNSAGQYCTKPGLLFVPAGFDAAGHVGRALGAAAPQPVMLTKAIAESVRLGITELEAAGAQVVHKVEQGAGGWAAPAAVLSVPIDAIRPGSRLTQECFGAVALVCEYSSTSELTAALRTLQPALVAGVWTSTEDPGSEVAELVEVLAQRVGRIVVNDWTTGAMHSWAQHHGGPWPATTDGRVTSIGAESVARFVRPVAYQNVPDQLLPTGARRDNPWRVTRRVNGRLEQVRA